MKNIKFDIEGFKNKDFAVRCKTEREAQAFFDYIMQTLGQQGNVITPYFNTARGEVGWSYRHNRYGVYYYLSNRYGRPNEKFLVATNYPINDLTIKFDTLELDRLISIDTNMLETLFGLAI